MKPLGADEIRGNWATLLLPWNDDDSLDLRRLGAEIDVLIAMNGDGIYSHGTAGEFHTRTEDEFDQVSELLANKRESAGMLFQIGASHISARISLERLKRAVSLRPGAIQIILPDWFPVTEAEAVTFLQRMSDAADGIGLGHETVAMKRCQEPLFCSTHGKPTHHPLLVSGVPCPNVTQGYHCCQ